MRSLTPTSLGLCLALFIGLSIWNTLDIARDERDMLLEMARLRTQHQAELLGENAAGLLQSVELILDSRTEQWCRLLRQPAPPPGADLEPVFLPVVSNVVLLDNTGLLRAETNSGGPRITPKDAPFFTEHRDGWVDFFLGSFSDGHRFDTTRIILSRRLDDDAGRFLGVAAAILDPRVFTRRYTDYAPVAPDGMGLYDRKGNLLLHLTATEPHHGHGSRRRITDLEPFRSIPLPQYLNQGGLRTMESDQDLVTTYQLSTFPLHIAVAENKSRILAPWQLRLQQRLAALTLVSIVLGLAAFMLLSQSKKKRQAELDLIKSKEQSTLYRSMFEKNPAAKLLIDPGSGQIIDANPAAVRFYGYEPGALLAQKIWDVNTQSIASIRSYMHKALNGIGSALKFTHRLADGTPRDVEVYSGPVELKDKTFLYSIIHDITDRVRYEKDLVEAKFAAEQASSAKGQFMANMSHEIRTPLNGILGMLQLLKTTTMSPEQKEYVKTGLDSGQGLLSVINDILDLSKVEAGRLELSLAPFQISRMLHSLQSIFRPQASSKKLTLEYIQAPDLPDLVMGDEARLRQVLFNLLGNALKFTESGTVSLRVSGTRTASGMVALTFSVQDTGMGISPELQKTIFEPFTQADGSSSRRHQGTGLGLSIVKRLLCLMDGTIQLRSEPGHGSTFDVSLTLPIATEVPKETQEPDAITMSALHILLAEDNKVNRLLARKLLEKEGHTVRYAENGRQAVEILACERFDCVLMDIQMPEMDGVEATKQIRLGACGVLQPDIPIIAMTAHALDEDRERFLSAGMDNHLPKPIMVDALQKILATISPREDVRKKVDSNEK